MNTGKGKCMNQDRKHEGGRKSRGTKPKVSPVTDPVADASHDPVRKEVTRMTVCEFAKEVSDWLIEWADEDDIQRFVAEFKGVPAEKIVVTGDNIEIIGE